MMDALGSAEAILSAPLDKLTRVDGVGPKTAEIIVGWRDLVDVEAEMAAAEVRGIKIVTQLDEDYPQVLLNMYDPPLVLYVWGEIKALDAHGIAMVGSRKHTYYGQQSARQLSFQLANAGYTIISGLARGIDTFSHEGAIAAGGRTLAVIGSGLGQLYPPENMALAEKIANGHGAVVSEFSLNTKPDKKTFPMRNRIVAGWASSVLVVECPQWSGSLITANLANDMGKPIYAVPGPIDSPSSAGCNKLIRSGATLVMSADDIVSDSEVLPLFDRPAVEEQKIVNPALLHMGDDEKVIYEVLSSQPMQMDQVMEAAEMMPAQVSVVLLQLEIKRLVQQLPGQHYVKREE